MAITKRLNYDLHDHGIDPEKWEPAYSAEGSLSEYVLAHDVATALGYSAINDLTEEQSTLAIETAAEWWPSPKKHGPDPIDWATADELMELEHEVPDAA